MPAAAGATLRPRERLTRGADYRRVFRGGLRLDGPLFLLVAATNGLDFFRLGLAVGRRVGGAVARNRAKRVLRECFRRNKPENQGYDLVLVPKRELSGTSQREVEREYQDRLRRLFRRGAGGRRPVAAPPG